MGLNLSGAWRGRGARGQSLVEFALVVPILLLMVVGILEFGRAWYMNQVIGDAARQGARTAAILHSELPPSQIRDSARQVVLRSLAAGSITGPNVHQPDVDGTSPSDVEARVTVVVDYSFGVFAPVMRLAGQSFNNGTIPLTGRAIMRNE